MSHRDQIWLGDHHHPDSSLHTGVLGGVPQCDAVLDILAFYLPIQRLACVGTICEKARENDLEEEKSEVVCGF